MISSSASGPPLPADDLLQREPLEPLEPRDPPEPPEPAEPGRDILSIALIGFSSSFPISFLKDPPMVELMDLKLLAMDLGVSSVFLGIFECFGQG